MKKLLIRNAKIVNKEFFPSIWWYSLQSGNSSLIEILIFKIKKIDIFKLFTVLLSLEKIIFHILFMRKEGKLREVDFRLKNIINIWKIAHIKKRCE